MSASTTVITARVNKATGASQGCPYSVCGLLTQKAAKPKCLIGIKSGARSSA